MPPKEIRKLTLTNVALVPEGSNPEAHILLYKERAPLPVSKAMTTAQMQDYSAACQDWYRLHDAFMQSLYDIQNSASGDEQASLMLQSVEEFVTLARPILARMGRGSVEDGMDKALHTCVKSVNPLDAVRALFTEKGLIMAGMPDPTVELAKAQARIAELEADLARRTAPAPTEEDIWKGVPEIVRKRYEEAEARAKNAEDIALKERDARQEATYIAKARTFKHLPLKPQEDWRIFKMLDDAPDSFKAAASRVLDLLKAADDTMGGARLTTRIGSASPEDTREVYGRGESPLVVAKARAAEVIAKAPTMSEADAMAAVFRADPELYYQYLDEQRSVARGNRQDRD